MSLDFTILEAVDGLRLSGHLDIYAVDLARSRFLEHLACSASLDLDLTDVKGCDTAGVQLLWAARQSTLRAGKPFRAKLSPSARQCCTRLGVPADLMESAAA
jgi:anti-anti-sigma regulatory factor